MNGGIRNGPLWRLTAAYVSRYPCLFSVNIDFDPGDIFSVCFEAPAKRELEFCERFGKPRLHVERYLREIY